MDDWLFFGSLYEFMYMYVCDAGLIKGACEGKGLGFEFLRHVERTSVLCYVVDASLPDAPEQLMALQLEVER